MSAAPARRAWWWFLAALLVALLASGGVAAVRFNQLSPIPTARLTATDPVDLGSFRFRLVSGPHEIPPPPEEAYAVEPNAMPGTTWLHAEVEVEALADVDDLASCWMELRNAAGQAWPERSPYREGENTSCHPGRPLARGEVIRVVGRFRVPDRDLVDPRVVVILPGLPARAFEVRP